MAFLAARRRALHLSLLAAVATAFAAAPARSAPAARPSLQIDIVGVLRVQAPAAPTVLLRGTLPLPKKAWVDVHATAPFVVLNDGGYPVLTQSEVVSRYPAAADGVDVAEVIARVNVPPGAKPGDLLQYRVVYLPHPVKVAPAASMAALISGPWALPGSVKALLQNPQSVLIEVIDPFGNPYRISPFDGKGKLEFLKHGPVQTQIRIAQTLRPTPAVSGPFGTLPHHLGVHVYLTVSAQDEILGFDVRFHNAHSGLDTSDTQDDPLGEVYFKSINLYASAPWFFVQDFLDPYVDSPSGGEGGYVKFPLVKPPAGGKMHAMQWQAQFHRRLSLAPLEKVAEAQLRARGQGLGFATRGSSPLTGSPYWSWWNPATARWFPQAHRLPSLDHALDDVELWLGKDHYTLETHLANGTATGPLSYPISSPVLGHAHPYGSSYGGMTGGLDINLYDGIRALEAASLIGYQLATMTHRMQSDRMPNVIYDKDGTSSTVEEWLKPKAGGGSYVPFEHFVGPLLKPYDPFGLHEAPKFQVAYVEAQGLAAPWVQALFEFGPYDFQHLVRYTRSAKALAWMANDALAKDDITAQAEIFHFSYHEHYNSSGGYIQSTGLLFDMSYVADHGPVGFTFGRGEAWGVDCAAAAYRLGTPAWRSKNRPWLDRIANLVADGQASCSGFIQATINGKFFEAKYRARQIIEQSIIEHALVGLNESVYRGAFTGMSVMIDKTLIKSTYSMLNPMAWDPNEKAPWAIGAVGPVDDALPPWCHVSQVPADGHSPYVDAFQNWSSFAYGFERTGDPVFLLAAQHQIGGDLVPLLLAQGLNNVENRAALLALVQGMIGL